ncbi:MAG TPA: hypothetical protein VN639_05135, partial [Azonexus sp.]|nr:hypothetical protein [Azonexus sp.]
MNPQSASAAGSPITSPGRIRLATFLARLIWLSILPLLLLSGWLAFNHVMSRREELDLQATDQVKNLAAAVDRYLTARIGALNVLAHSPLLDEATSRQPFYREAQGFQQSFGSHVVLATLDMQMLFNTRLPFDTASLPKLPRPGGRAAAPIALETGRAAVGDTFFGPVAKEAVVAIAVPVI